MHPRLSGHAWASECPAEFAKKGLTCLGQWDECKNFVLSQTTSTPPQQNQSFIILYRLMPDNLS